MDNHVDYDVLFTVGKVKPFNRYFVHFVETGEIRETQSLEKLISHLHYEAQKGRLKDASGDVS